MSLTWPRKRREAPPVACGHGARLAELVDALECERLRLKAKTREAEDFERLLDAALGQVAAAEREARLAAQRLASLEKGAAEDRLAADEQTARLLRAVELADADRDAHDAEMRRLTVALRECAEEGERLRGLAAVQAEPGEWPDCGGCPARQALDAATAKAEEILRPGGEVAS